MSGGLEQVWWFTCKYENIDPVYPTRLPLLFALDEKLNVPGGATYHRGEHSSWTRSGRVRGAAWIGLASGGSIDSGGQHLGRHQQQRLDWKWWRRRRWWWMRRWGWMRRWRRQLGRPPLAKAAPLPI